MGKDQHPGRQPLHEQAGSPGSVLAEDPILAVALKYIAAQLGELLELAPEVRADGEDSIHRLRTATRQLRSALDTYRGLFKADAVEPLERELKWLARILGDPRDAEVLRERLAKRIPELPARLRSAAAPLDHMLETRYESGRLKVIETLDGDRYRKLVDSLAGLRDAPPATDRARRKATTEGARLLRTSIRELERAHRAAEQAAPGAAADIALHRVRKDAKKLMHAAESLCGTLPQEAGLLARKARRLQKTLGRHQDSVMMCAFLESAAADPAAAPEAGAACKKIRQIEEASARAAAERFDKAWRKASLPKLRRRLRNTSAAGRAAAGG